MTDRAMPTWARSVRLALEMEFIPEHELLTLAAGRRLRSVSELLGADPARITSNMAMLYRMQSLHQPSPHE